MTARRSSPIASALCSLILYAPSVLGHMEMSWPYPLHSKFDPENTYKNIDYSMTTPLEPDGSNFPCKGYQNDRPVRATVTYAAGSTYNMTLAGSATHNGGSCQISLSYDNGATFRVIKSMIGGCPLVSTYDFTIPSYAPSGNALLGWTWQNRDGNREFYMNCAEVNIISGTSRRRRRQGYNNFESLPYIWKANLEGVNDCTTPEGEDPVYPNPGPDVIYGKGMSSSDMPNSETCDSPTPYGQTYKDLGDSSSGPAPGGNETYPMPSSSAAHGYEYSPPSSTPMSIHQGRPTTRHGHHNFAAAATTSVAPTPYAKVAGFDQKLAATSSSKPLSTVTVTADCVSTITVFIPPPPIATTRGPTTRSSRLITSTTRPATPLPTNGGRGSGNNNNNNRPPYAAGDLTRYLPCVPGTFLCTSRTTWSTCNYNDGSVSSSQQWVYVSPRQVAAGMECLPNLAPYSGQTKQYAQQGNVKQGNYRDDRIVRARPDGDCETDGSSMCTDGGSQFMVCDQAGWVRMGSVAAGTTCKGGKIVAA